MILLITTVRQYKSQIISTHFINLLNFSPINSAILVIHC